MGGIRLGVIHLAGGLPPKLVVLSFVLTPTLVIHRGDVGVNSVKEGPLLLAHIDDHQAVSDGQVEEAGQHPRSYRALQGEVEGHHADDHDDPGHPHTVKPVEVGDPGLLDAA